MEEYKFDIPDTEKNIIYDQKDIKCATIEKLIEKVTNEEKIGSEKNFLFMCLIKIDF